MGSRAWRARAATLVFVGALAVHELRYALTGRAADEHAHAYMQWALPLAIALLAIGVVDLLARMALRGRSSPPSAAGVRWLAVSTLLLAIFCAQEIAEVALAHGHVDVRDVLVHHGAWVGAPLCFVAGAVVTLLLRGARALLALGSQRATPRRAELDAASPRTAPRARRAPLLACHLAGRAPPVVI